MKNVLLTGFLLFTSLLLIPLIAWDSQNTESVPVSAPFLTEKKVSSASAKNVDSFRIKHASSGKIEVISAEDYLRGVIAAEMPVLYEEEALKAQTVAAYTFACRKKALAKNSDFDLTDDPQTDQCYLSDDELDKRWGENAEEYRKKIDGIISAVKGKSVTYNGELALTVFHAISYGRTESSANVWGGEVPYLIPVDSVGDKMSDKYLSFAVFSPDELSAALSGLCEMSGEASGWFSKPELTESGRVKKISVCGKELSGGDVANALALRSACFEVGFKDGVFTFTVRGYGHGVGMSQNGANYMAQQGSKYDEILLWYYPGCKISG